jgi:hypothetical protein
MVGVIISTVLPSFAKEKVEDLKAQDFFFTENTLSKESLYFIVN